MNCSRGFLLGFTFLTIVLGPAVAMSGEPETEFEDFADLDLESLLDMTVVTASKYEQKIGDTPADITVITAQEIAASGARSIPEVLRRIPGIDVLQTSSSTYDVSARGLNKPGSNTMLVLIDGRSIYVDLYGMTMWDQIPIGLEDIKAIEVIKGPGSAVYGANAFAGVVNIISYPVGEKKGTSARSMVSSLGEAYGEVRHEGRNANTTWRLDSAWDRSEDWENRTTETEVSRFNFLAHRDFGKDSELSVGASFVEANSRLIPPNVPLDTDGKSSDQWAEYAHDDFRARWYSNRHDIMTVSTTMVLGPEQLRFENTIHDFELQQNLSLYDKHRLLAGANYRHKVSRYSQQGVTYKDDIYAGFLLEEWRASEKLFISAGMRYEHNPAISSHVSPRGGLVYRPANEHSFRLSYGKAYRDPSYIETHWSTDIDLFGGLQQLIHGNPDNKSEVMEAYEIGYQGMLTSRLLVSVTAYRNAIDDIIQPVVVDFYQPPTVPQPIPKEITLGNLSSWRATGGEISWKYDPEPWLRLSGGYSYLWLKDADTGARQAVAPVHAGSFAVRFAPHGSHEIRLAARYRSGTTWPASSATPQVTYGDELIFVDLGWSVLASHGCSFTLAAENVLDRRVRDHPQSIEQRRRILISLSQRF